MNKINRISLIILLTCLQAACFAQQGTYTAANAHAHNDYLQDNPFYDAFNSGFGSIEADVFPLNGKLHVAHHKSEIKPGSTLTALYIEPLAKELQKNNRRKLILLIDIKEDHILSLGLLMKELEPLRPYLHTASTRGALTIVISGERPAPADFDRYPGYIWFDSDLKHSYTNYQWERVALVSLPFNKLTEWKATGDPRQGQLSNVQSIIDSVHSAGKPIRFWAAPDNRLSWQWQQKMKVDLIGTDKINELCNFLKKEDD